MNVIIIVNNFETYLLMFIQLKYDNKGKVFHDVFKTK